ncbi:MAG: glycerol-3-phosphate 1-O-acyltransferase PlsY [Rickettsiales bacterium]|jgi:glycerol-3-phosphate acyltransferase PlsY|nr:glycerol-3-phosphate 1-O-acyltransferase PlsY [Rickettsiales bacterium]
MIYLIAIIVSYLLGSVPFGLLVTKLAGKGDLRRVGSGNIGATNVMRAGGLKLAGLVWILDMAKSAAAVGLGYAVAGEGFAAWCGFAAFVGHCYPIWLKFKGGKGVSSLFGFMLALSPVMFAAQGLIWLIIALPTGYSSLAAWINWLLLPVFGFVINFWVGIICTAMAVLGLWAQRENIKKFAKGTESKIEWKWKK